MDLSVPCRPRFATATTNAVAVAAAVLNLVCYAPQIVLLLRTKKAADISVLSFSLFGAYATLMGTYGVLRGDWPLFAMNLLSGVQNSAVVLLSLYYRRRGARVVTEPAGVSC
jgi:uncharacterized protein with PQ loop repeat